MTVKLSPEDREDLVQMRRDGLSAAAIAKELGVHPRTVCRNTPEELKGYTRRFTDEERAEAKRLRALGYSITALMKRFGTAHRYVKRNLLGE